MCSLGQGDYVGVVRPEPSVLEQPDFHFLELSIRDECRLSGSRVFLQLRFCPADDFGTELAFRRIYDPASSSFNPSPHRSPVLVGRIAEHSSDTVCVDDDAHQTSII